MSDAPEVLIVHCVDTEGPLHEPLAATFERIRSVYGVSLTPSYRTLQALQQRQLDLGEATDPIAIMVAPSLLRYNSDWSDVDEMLTDCMSADFRTRYADSTGKGWIYNWFCVDHVGYADNARRRDIGFHHISDHYRQMMAEDPDCPDSLHFHFHPMPITRQAHHCGNHFFANGNTIFEILSRNVIDRHWFPSVYRPGFDVIRPDSNWFLEQFVPFEYSNQRCDDTLGQPDLTGGRFGDWRRAPDSWRPYHPDHDDYQIPGNCRRWITRCLNLGTRMRLLDQTAVDAAFAEAQTHGRAILSFTDHDFRDLRPNVARCHEMVLDAAKRFPGVTYKNAEARSAYRRTLDIAPAPPIAWSIEWTDNRLDIRSDRRTFGPQPYLAMKSLSGTYHHENLDIQEPFRHWSYVFDEHNLSMHLLDRIGIASCDSAGTVSGFTIKPGSTDQAAFAY
jgi:hypothetical protein